MAKVPSYNIKYNIQLPYCKFFKNFISVSYLQLNNSSTTICAECFNNASKGPNGRPEPLTACEGCGVSLHSSCASLSANTTETVPLALLVKKGSKWFCEECRSVCESCHASARGTCLLGCCGCEKNYHLSCLDPVPDKKPKCPWR